MPSERSSAISLPGVARLARVQRPVVSMWRSRAKTTDSPFPDAIAVDGRREFFDVHAVADWLVSTGRGNNPEARDDAAAAALLDRLSELDPTSRNAIAALIALSAVVDERVTTLGADDIIDLADEIDPDDEALLGELESMRAGLEELAQSASEIVDAAYSHRLALADVDGGSSSSARAFATGTGLREGGTGFLTSLAHDVIRSIPHVDAESPVIADVTGSATGFAATLATSLPESFSPIVAVPHDERTSSRRIRRQLLVNGIGLADITSAPARAGAEGRPVLRTVTLGGGDDSERDLTRAVEALADLGDSERAVVYGPARVLTDAGVSAGTDRLRAELIRSGQLRAIVKLPRGLIEASPRQSLALWVFAPVAASVPLSDRWTLVADASDREMDAVTTASIIDDVVAALGKTATLRAHAFSVGRPVRTSTLAASEGSLVASRGAIGHTPEVIDRSRTREIPARIDEVLVALAGFGDDLGQRLTTTSLEPSLRTAEAGALLKEGHLRYTAGTRIAPSELQSDGGYRVIGPPQVTRGSIDDAPFVDRLQFSRQHPNAQLTEPGDVVFIAGRAPSAIVDDAGASVVAYPARVLRIDADDPAGLLAPIVAADIRRQTSSEWKRWTLRRIVSGQRDSLHDTLAAVERERRELQARLDALDSLTDLVADGVAAGRITLTPPPEPQPKGTR